MKKILYIGNKLSGKGNSITGMETLVPQLKSLGYSIVSASDKQNQLVRLIDMVYNTVKYCRNTNFILIDTYSYKGFIYASVISRICRLLSVPYIPILRGGNLPYRLDKSPNECKRIFSQSFSNIAPSKYLLNEFQKRNYTAHFIPNNINIGNYKYKCRSFLSPKLLFVRSFDAIYNPQMAIEVVRKMIGKYPDVQLCMVGPDKDGSLEKCRRLVQEYGLEEKVRFTGILSKKEWHTLSEQFDIFINTTNIDNTPISVIEALALGLPVVSTCVGGIPYLLSDEEDALLVEKQNEDAMVSAIDRLLSDSKLAINLSQNGRKKAESFDWYNVKTKWQNLFN